MNKTRHYTLVAAAVLAGSLGAATFDVSVVGGGPAGIGAALASAKSGAKTVLVERDARLGGTTVSAEVLPIGLFHAWNRQVIAGPCWELVTNAYVFGGGKLPDFPKLNPRDWGRHCLQVNPFVYSVLAAETMEKAGVELRFNAAACGVERTSDGWKISLATDEGIQYITAKEVVDATGSATVAAFAGAERVRADDVQRQPGSFFFHLNTRGWKFDAAAVDKAHAEAVASGELKPTDIHIRMSDYIRAGGGWGCYVPLADNSTATARAETNRRGRETMLRVIRFIRRQPGLEKATIVSASPEVGVRETYRVVGEKTLFLLVHRRAQRGVEGFAPGVPRARQGRHDSARHDDPQGRPAPARRRTGGFERPRGELRAARAGVVHGDPGSWRRWRRSVT